MDFSSSSGCHLNSCHVADAMPGVRRVAVSGEPWPSWCSLPKPHLQAQVLSAWSCGGMITDKILPAVFDENHFSLFHSIISYF